MTSGAVVHLVDDDEAIRKSVGFLLRQAGHLVEVYADGSAFLRSVTPDSQGCALLDVRMPDVDGLEVQNELAQRGIGLPVIMLTGHGDITLAVRAVKAGAIEFLEKPFERTALLQSIDMALDQAVRVKHNALASSDAIFRIASLTDRERDVFGAMVLGRPNKLIAFDLGIATRTVEVHRANLMGKLSARSLSDVFKLAFAAGLIP